MDYRGRHTRWIWGALVGTCILTGTFAGCSSSFSSMTLPSTAFLADVDTTGQIEAIPFTHAAVWKEVAPGTYSRVFIAPVTVAPEAFEDWEMSKGIFITSRESYEEYIRGVGVYFQEQVHVALEKQADKKFVLVDAPGPGTVTVAIELTKAIFSRPVAQGMITAIPVPGTNLISSTIHEPRAAFAMKIFDSESGELIATLGDVRTPPLRVVDFNKLTVTSPIREVCETWALLIAETFTKQVGQTVENRGKFALLPW